MTKAELNKIKKAFKSLYQIEWVESHIVGYVVKTGTLNRELLTIMNEFGYQIRHARPYVLDRDYLIVYFEPKEIQK
jgi:hypothetical protein